MATRKKLMTSSGSALIASNSVAIVDANGDLIGDADLTFVTDTLTTTKLIAKESKQGDGTTNYTNFDTTGHQTMVGTAKPWDDIRVEPVARTSGTNAPTFEKWLDDAAGTSRGVYLYSFDNAVLASEKEIFFTLQMPHGWDGGNLHLHVHWIAELSENPAKVRWGLEYAWKEITEVFGDTTIIYADTDTEGSTTTTALKHVLTEFAEIVPGATADGLSSIFIGRLFRNSSAAEDTSTGKAGLLYIDAHYQINSIGSTDELSK